MYANRRSHSFMQTAQRMIIESGRATTSISCNLRLRLLLIIARRWAFNINIQLLAKLIEYFKNFIKVQQSNKKYEERNERLKRDFCSSYILSEKEINTYYIRKHTYMHTQDNAFLNKLFFKIFQIFDEFRESLYIRGHMVYAKLEPSSARGLFMEVSRVSCIHEILYSLRTITLKYASNHLTHVYVYNEILSLILSLFLFLLFFLTLHENVELSTGSNFLRARSISYSTK